GRVQFADQIPGKFEGQRDFFPGWGVVDDFDHALMNVVEISVPIPVLKQVDAARHPFGSHQGVQMPKLFRLKIIDEPLAGNGSCPIEPSSPVKGLVKVLRKCDICHNIGGSPGLRWKQNRSWTMRRT